MQYPIDNNAFLFSFDNKKIFNAIKGKKNICWINDDTFGLCFYGSLSFYNKFLTTIHTYTIIGKDISSYFENCSINDFNSGIKKFKFSELEVFQII